MRFLNHSIVHVWKSKTDHGSSVGNKLVCVCVCVQGCKKASVKRELKEKRDSEETKENQKTKSDDSGEEKNGEENAHKNNAHRKKGVFVQESEGLLLPCYLFSCVCGSVPRHSNQIELLWSCTATCSPELQTEIILYYYSLFFFSFRLFQVPPHCRTKSHEYEPDQAASTGVKVNDPGGAVYFRLDKCV